MAIFTLPEEMFSLYKTKLDYLEEHAVDPDKRRYATFEAIRHYIDSTNGAAAFNDLPCDWEQCPGLIQQLTRGNRKQ